MAAIACTVSPGGHWEHFPHDADVGIRGFGASPALAFEQIALALTAVIAEPDTVRALQPVVIECASTDLELLLVAWLNAIVYEMATRHLLFGRYEVRIDGLQLRAQAWGEPVDVARHQPATEVKGATLTELRVVQEPGGPWRAQCVIDV